jgi:DNA processing protein
MTAERHARAALTYLAEPADTALAGLVARLGAPGTVEAIKTGRAPGVTRTQMTRWRARLGELPAPGAIAGFARAGIRLICPGDPEWPGRLADLGETAPYALWLRGNGDLRNLCLRSVAIVGSRAATAYGSYVATELATTLARRGWTIVSGGAYGIDAGAHRGALAAGAATIAVLACGVDHPYPAGHTALMDAIAARGLVISEWPPGRNATRLRFLSRNRVIAALAAGTLVVEAAARSGALNTARYARDMNRPLMAVPGPVTSQMSHGCHMMIRQWNATLVTTATEVTEHLEPAGSIPPPQQPVLPWDELEPALKAVLDALPARHGVSTDDVSITTGLDPQSALRALGALAAGGFAERSADGWRVCRSHATGAFK